MTRRCPRCGETKVLHNVWHVCIECAVEEGWVAEGASEAAKDTPDDLDRYLAEQLKDPEFARAWYRQELRDWRAAYERGKADGLRQADSAITWGTSCLGCADKLDGLYEERSRGYEEGKADGRAPYAAALEALAQAVGQYTAIEGDFEVSDRRAQELRMAMIERETDAWMLLRPAEPSEASDAQ